MHLKRIFLIALCAVSFLAACSGPEGKIDKVKKTVIPDCQGKTMDDLAKGLLQHPVWSYEETTDGKKFVMVNGTIAGDSMPGWIKEQKILDARFRFALDPKTEQFDPASLRGFPSLASPDGIFQAYKTMVCP